MEKTRADNKTQHKAVKILDVILNIVFTLSFFVFLLAVLVFKAPEALGYKTYVVASGSMEPTIGTGSIVYVDPNDKNVRIGDVVTFHASTDPESIIVTHRIHEITDDGSFVTKGDANTKPDPEAISHEQIIGKEKFTLPYVGYLSNNPAFKTTTIAVMLGTGLSRLVLG